VGSLTSHNPIGLHGLLREKFYFYVKPKLCSTHMGPLDNSKHVKVKPALPLQPAKWKGKEKRARKRDVAT
jgi:hypothetical protein